MRILPANPPPATAPSGGGQGELEVNLHHDAVTRQALNALVSSTEQSYEQFLTGFSHLTTADVAPSVIQRAYAGYEEHPLFLAPVQRPRLPSPPTVPFSPVPTGDGLDELEEEILDASNNQTSSLTSLVDPPPKRHLQMDNFVEDEGDENSSDDDDSLVHSVGSDYIASFSASTDRSSADVLSRPTSCDLSIASSSLSLNNKVHSINLITVETPRPTLLTGKDSLDGEEEEDLVYDPRLDRPNPGEVDDEVVETSAERAASEASITNLRDMAYSARPAEPGEVVSYQATAIEKFEVESVTSEVVAMDEVEAFTLDDDFDYDNVILTPKFPPEEQAVLDELARKGKEEREAEAAREEASSESELT